MEEFHSATLVALEVPPAALKGFARDVSKFVVKVRSVGPDVLAIVQPSLRKRTQRSLRVQRWNRMEGVPFGFKQTCSRKLGMKWLQMFCKVWPAEEVCDKLYMHLPGNQNSEHNLPGY